MNKLSIIAVMIASLTPAIAQANPTWTYRLSATALSGSNILLTNTYGGGKPSNDIAVFYGTSHSEWVDRPDTSADTGSGSRTLHVREICDCHVPAKTLLRYQLSPEWAYAWGGGACEVTSTDFGSVEPCRTACALADARDAAAPADGPSAGDARGDEGPDGVGGADVAGDSTVEAAHDACDAAAEADAPIAGAGGGGGAPGGGGAGGSTSVVSGGAGGSSTAASAGATGSGGATAPVESGGVSGNRASTSALTSTAAKKGGGASCSLALAARPSVLSAVWVLGALALAVTRRRRS